MAIAGSHPGERLRPAAARVGRNRKSTAAGKDALEVTSGRVAVAQLDAPAGRPAGRRSGRSRPSGLNSSEPMPNAGRRGNSGKGSGRPDGAAVDAIQHQVSRPRKGGGGAGGPDHSARHPVANRAAHTPARPRGMLRGQSQATSRSSTPDLHADNSGALTSLGAARWGSSDRGSVSSGGSSPLTPRQRSVSPLLFSPPPSPARSTSPVVREGSPIEIDGGESSGDGGQQPGRYGGARQQYRGRDGRARASRASPKATRRTGGGNVRQGVRSRFRSRRRVRSPGRGASSPADASPQPRRGVPCRPRMNARWEGSPSSDQYHSPVPSHCSLFSRRSQDLEQQRAGTTPGTRGRGGPGTAPDKRRSTPGGAPTAKSAGPSDQQASSAPGPIGELIVTPSPDRHGEAELLGGLRAFLDSWAKRNDAGVAETVVAAWVPPVSTSLTSGGSGGAEGVSAGSAGAPPQALGVSSQSLTGVGGPSISDLGGADLGSVSIAEAARYSSYTSFSGPLGVHLKVEVREKIWKGDSDELYLFLAESNKKAHHTDIYNCPDLVLRRGQSFRLSMEFSKPLKDWQSIVFTAQTGPPNAQASNTTVQFALSNSWTSGIWSAVLESNPGNSLQIIMCSPANAVIGRYNLSVNISINGELTNYSLGKFILLFNPWCLDDDVYMANEDERNEYVLNDHGIIFMGNEKHISPMGWNYGQFENNILLICLNILDRSLNYQNDPASDCSQRNNPIYVGRVISAMINSNDDYGVLEGKWEKDFSDGVDPNSWNGSVEILWSWQKDDFKPVKYGQCWVFAAVMCTVLRCLGIPTRVITNFNSAHNTDANLNVDLHFDTEGKYLEIHDDSIWNFHVWNESWFMRRDLGQYYSGWQVLDSTPQEQSQGIYRCGPTSVIAVKEGDVSVGYDTPFVFAEVNADRVVWVLQKDGTKEKAHNDTKYVGQSISTKAVGSDARVDITHNYKYPEGSPEEREVFEKASRNMAYYRVPPERTSDSQPITRENRNSMPEINGFSPLPERNRFPSMPAINGFPPMPERNALSPTPERNTLPPIPETNAFRVTPVVPPLEGPDIAGKFKLLSPLVVGDDINLILVLKNLTPYHRPVKVNLSASCILYTGRRVDDIFADQKSLVISPSQDAHVSLQIPYSMYQQRLRNGNMIQVVALCELPFGEKVLITKDLVLANPPLQVKTLGKALLNKMMTLEIRFTNPLSVPVKDMSLLVEGSGLVDRQLTAVVPFLKPKEKIRFKVELTPYRTGTRQLIINFKCKHFLIKGYKHLEVKSV
ncbi:protein-glutamine gamma-glutamyltransferase E-like [Pelodytes ibericus]